MPQDLLSSLQTSTLPIAEIGREAHRLTQAIDLALPVVPTAIIPISSLKEIAEHNQLGEKVERYLRQLNFDDSHQVQAAITSIKRAIQTQHIPDHLHRHLIQVYHRQLNQDWVRLTASFIDEGRSSSLVHENVKGDVNVFESLLSLWSETIKATGNRIELFPAAIMIQAQPQPVCAGFIFTAQPATHNKTRYVIESLWGVFREELGREKDAFEIDTRTYNVVKAETGSQHHYFERTLDGVRHQQLPLAQQGQPSLTPLQLKQLGEWATKLKQHFLSQLKIEWQLHHGRLQLVAITPFTLSQVETTHHQEILAIGDSFIGGYVHGPSRLLLDPKDTFVNGSILVVSRLTKSHQGLVRHAAAIVTEEPITDSLLTQLINYYHIPTVTNAAHITRRLSSNHEIIVDANSGKVLKHSQAATSLKTATKVVSIVNNPYTHLEPYADGHYFKSDYALATHNPRSIKDVLLKRLTSLADQPLWYRFSTLSTDTEEANPYFGRRGALVHLTDPSLFHFEVELIKKIVAGTAHHLRLVLPFVRTPAERELFIHQLRANLGEEMSRVEIWLELINLDSLINLGSFLTPQIKGVILPVAHLHALWYGLDPENPSLLKQYPLNGELMGQLLSFVKPHLGQIMVELTQPHPALLEKVVARGVPFIATKESQLKSSKEQLRHLEERQISHGHH